MPIFRIRGRASSDARQDVRERCGAVRRPKADLATAEVDVVGKVVPVVRLELGAPLCITVDVPAQGIVGRTGLSVDQTVFDLSEVTLKESDLMLVSGIGRIRRGRHEREVII